MNVRKWVCTCLWAGASSLSLNAAIRVYVQDQGGIAWLRYACTGGEVVRGFALNVEVDRGAIVGVTNFFVGPSRLGATGYGIFPASFRDHIQLQGGTTPDWSVPGYSPVAAPQDLFSDTLPGLGSPGLTLEFAALWDSAQPTAAPSATGTLCALVLSQPSQVTVTGNISRGGVVVVNSDANPLPIYYGSAVGPLITSSQVANGLLQLSFHGGEIQTGPSAQGPWSGTGNTSGSYTEAIDQIPSAKFYRVHAQ